MACVREPHVQPNVKRKPPYIVVPTKNCPSNGRPRPQYSHVASALCADGGGGRQPRFNPKGIGSSNPGLARFRESLPWVAATIPKGFNHSAQGWPILRGLPCVAAFELHNPERVEYQILTK